MTWRRRNMEDHRLPPVARKVIPVIVLALLGVASCGTTAASPPTPTGATRTVTDTAGQVIEVPTKITRIADSWPAHNSLLQLLGAGSEIVATTATVQQIPLFRRINPHIAAIPAPFDSSSDTVNIEDLIRQRPDVVFTVTTTSESTLEKLHSVGLPVVQVYFDDFVRLAQCVTLTGSILGPDAAARAGRYVTYLNQSERMVRARTDSIPSGQRPSVAHLAQVSPQLWVDGRNTIIDQWITIAGGRNAAHDQIDGNQNTITFEQLLAWNPDVIIVGSTPAGEVAKLRSDPRWQQLKAVREGRLYTNPKGIFPWDRYGPEEALQIQWAAQTLHPDLFRDLDLNQVTRAFYQDFMRYPLSAADLREIFQPSA